MALTTLYKDPHARWSVEEDARGRLWLEVVCGQEGMQSLHHELTPGEAKEFRRYPGDLAPLVRRITGRPRQYFDKREEAEYRRATGSG